MFNIYFPHCISKVYTQVLFIFYFIAYVSNLEIFLCVLLLRAVLSVAPKYGYNICLCGNYWNWKIVLIIYLTKNEISNYIKDIGDDVVLLVVMVLAVLRD